MAFVIGLTGGISSGKSLISSYLHDLGAMVIDADKLAREVVEPGSPVLEEIRGSFGDEVINEDGTLCRKKLGDIVFNCEEERRRLNDIIHPRVFERIKELINENKDDKTVPVIVIDAPLLIETGLMDMTEEVWVVSLKEEAQLKRLMKRDALTRKVAESRLKTQMPLNEKIKFADRVIDNNGSKEDTLRSVQTIWEELIRL
ncbi:MAG: dephospho-CoA kinase [Firmicutes bacterium HGW-Firmicutes-12]|jgi:dephospho-CoA kinase|nr:MAG: dephospho-CoA kinase [Firmicutes bacterium HGW-Firmicutes-12]